MKLELHQLDEKYADLRVVEAAREQRLAASIAEYGQQTPIVVVTGAGDRFILVDGYLRTRVLRSLGRDEAEAVVLEMPEADALVLSYRLDNTRTRSALEEGWMLRALVDEHGVRQCDLAARLDRSESWVSRRLGLVRTLPASVQDRTSGGAAVSAALGPGQPCPRRPPSSRARSDPAHRVEEEDHDPPQIAQRWILARLRDEVFYSLEALRARVPELLGDLNARPMKKYGGVSRSQLFERIEKAELRPLPTARFEYCEWKTCRVNIDYHVDVERHYYSVPHELVHEKVDARFTTATVEILHRGKRVASHARSFVPGKHTTVREHMPAAHQKHLEWTPSRILDWAQKTGPSTATLVDAIMKERRHPEQGYRSCLGILRLGKTYGADRLEAACARAVAVRARTYRSVKSILENGLDRLPLPDAPADPSPGEPEVHETNSSDGRASISKS